jgi:hypothetical protein
MIKNNFPASPRFLQKYDKTLFVENQTPRDRHDYRIKFCKKEKFKTVGEHNFGTESILLKSGCNVLGKKLCRNLPCATPFN